MADLYIDFECYYDSMVTLKKINLSEYVRKTDVQLLGAFHFNRLHLLEPHEIKPFLAEIDWPNTTLIGHNLLFDALVLDHFYSRRAAYHRDTLCMARALYPCSKHSLADMARLLDCPIQKGELKTKGQRRPDMAQLKQYCAQDVLITHFLDQRLTPQMTPASELDTIDHTIKLWLNPTLIINTTLLRDTMETEREEQRLAIQATGLTKEEIRSDAKFAAYLKQQGYEPPTKWSLKQNKEVFAFAKNDPQWGDFINDNPEIESLLTLKSTVNSNIKETRAERILKSVTPDNRLPIAYNYHGAFTGRFCLTGDTQIYVLRDQVILDTILSDLRPTDLVWDGEEFVEHDGLLHQGTQEIITYDGISGTPNHRVYVEAREEPTPIELGRAMARGYPLKTGVPPPGFATDITDSSVRGHEL